jgi:DNA-binding NtrC family response regulator
MADRAETPRGKAADRGAERHVLVVEDERAQRELLAQLLTARGFTVRTADSLAAARRELGAASSDCVVTDFQLPDGTGLDVLREARDRDPAVGVVLVSAFGTVPMAVDAMRGGAFDVMLKPVDPEALLQVLARAAAHRDLLRENARLRARLDEPVRVEGVVAESPAFRRVLDVLARVAPSDATVLVSGESGTGKELVARRIHAASRRAEGPFVAVNCGALPEGLLESELFGHARGAFTGAVRERRGRFEEADGGTLFLDEVGEMAPALQVRLLRVLQEREIVRVGENVPRRVDVRVVAATNRDLKTDVQSGRFREDLYYRLEVVPVHLPPLRERPEDLAPLVEALVARAAARHDRPPPLVSREAFERLRAHRWPGNVRELANALERAVLLCRGDVVRVDDLPESARAPSESDLATAPPRETLEQAVQALEISWIRAALDRAGGIQTRAALELGIDERVLRYKLKKYGLKSGDAQD